MHRIPARTKIASLGALTLTGGVALLATFASVPASSATTTGLTIDTPCVREDSSVKFRLAGFAPDAMVSISDNGQFLSNATVGPAGDFTGEFNGGGTGDLFYVPHTITAADSAGNSGTATYAVAELGVVSKPVSDKPTAKVSYYAQGFVEGGTLYAHYTFSKSETVKKPLKTVALGALTGPCGTITTKKVTQLPIKKAKKGVYEIQFDTSKVYKRQQGVYFETTVFVPKNQKK